MEQWQVIQSSSLYQWKETRLTGVVFLDLSVDGDTREHVVGVELALRDLFAAGESQVSETCPTETFGLSRLADGETNELSAHDGARRRQQHVTGQL
jgi:hypothetical protein